MYLLVIVLAFSPQILAHPLTLCGHVFVNESQPRNQHIVGGEVANIGAWPWIGPIVHSVKGQWCGGTIVNSKWILTAAHCFVLPYSYDIDNNTSDWTFVSGEHTLTSDNETNEVIHQIEDIIVHPLYNPFPIADHRLHQDDAAPHDLALLKIAGTGIQFNNYIQPLCIPTTETFDFREPMCYAAGWGDTKDFYTDYMQEGLLQQVHSEILDHGICQILYENNTLTNVPMITDNHICFGDASKGTCVGDSGGPLMCKKNNLWYLAGVTSFGYAKCDNSGVFTETSKYADWLEDVMLHHGF